MKPLMKNPVLRQTLRVAAIVLLGGLWGARALNANAQDAAAAQPQYLVSPGLYSDGERSTTTCEFQRFGTFTQLVCERREDEPCDRGSLADTDKDGEDKPRTRLIRRGCGAAASGVSGLQPGEILVVRGGRSEIVNARR